jgi:hypothetical protein
MPRKVEVREVRYLASARAKFPGQQSNQAKPPPLAEAKGPQKLPFRVLKGRRNRVYSGEWQAYTSTPVEWQARYCKSTSRSNEFQKVRTQDGLLAAMNLNLD